MAAAKNFEEPLGKCYDTEQEMQDAFAEAASDADRALRAAMATLDCEALEREAHQVSHECMEWMAGQGQHDCP